MTTLEDLFPPYRLRITCGPVELRVLRDDDIGELVDLIGGGIFDPDLPLPFLRAWHEPVDVGGPNGFPSDSLRWWWRSRAMSTPDDWHLGLAVRRDGILVGMQDMSAKDFPLLRRVGTGSWLGRSHHGKGTGTLMRQMAVGFAFDELDALSCHSEYIDGNVASQGVSRKTGYVDNGEDVIVQTMADGTRVRAVERAIRVTPDTYVRPAEPITYEGTADLRRFLGIEREG